MLRCDRCGTPTDAPTKFCGHCGAKFVPRPEPISAGEDGAYYCQKHRKEITRVTCGKCERPICHKCTVMSAAGVRCPECARNRRPLRMRGALHSAAHAIGPLDQRKVWYLYLLSVIARIFGGWWR